MDSTTPSTHRALPVAGIVTGGIVALIALVLLLAGAGLLWASTANTDGNGWWTSGEHRYATSTRALTTQKLDIGADAPRWMFGSDHVGDVRVRATPTSTATPVFVGVGPTRKVQAYLGQAARVELTDLDFDPFRADFTRREGDNSELARPASQGFWAASSTGTGRRSVDWQIRRGSWSVVVMNANASPGVSVRLSASAKVPLVHDVAVGLLIAGGVIGTGAGILLALGSTGLRRRRPLPPAPSLPLGV
ncbi:MAG TPA: hypothetical protein VH276_19245 [Solirubrobacteraceae bacterium]|nr:hypothetical protein [Solirubrobacteraceae bacterium]